MSEASLAVVWGGGKRRRLFPLPRLPLGSLRSPIFFPFSLNAEPSLKLLSSLPFPSSIPVIFFFVFLVSSVELLNELTRRRLLRSRETDGQEKPALSFKKYENGARHCIFNLVHLIAHQILEPFFIKTFCCRKLLSYHFVMVLLSSHYLSRPVCLC